MDTITITLPNGLTKQQAFELIADARGFLDGDKYNENVITIPAGEEIPANSIVKSENYTNPEPTIVGYEYMIDSVDEDGNPIETMELFDDIDENHGTLIGSVEEVPEPVLESTTVIVRTLYTKVGYGIHMFGVELIEWFTRITKDAMFEEQKYLHPELDTIDKVKLNTDGSAIS